MKGFHAVAAALLAAVAASCSSVRVNTDYDPEADFSALHSYAWLAESQPRTGDPRLDNALLDARIRGAIDAQLAKQGLRKAASSEADFLVAYYVAVERKVDVETIYRSYGRVGWGGGGWSDTVVSEYEEGTLLIDFLRPGTGSLLWRGTAQARLRERRSPEAREEYAREVVAQILGSYPPK